MKFLIFLVVCFLLFGCAPDQRRYHSQIISIGGCDSKGMCGVKLQNGTILSDVRQPVIGSLPDCSTNDSCHEIIQ